MRSVMRRVALAVAALGFVVGAAGQVRAGLTVSIFDNGSFVDTAGGYAAESDAVQASLTSLGHTVSTFTGITAADFSAAGAAAHLILIPELERGDLNAALSPASRTAIANYVAAGGGLIIMGQHSRDVSLLNAVFGYSLTLTGSVGNSILTSAAVGTPYAGGPGSLPNFSATTGVAVSSLPGVALNLYQAGSSNTVFVSDFGAGRVARLGWDWFNAAPLGSNDSGWLNVLDTTVNYVGETSVAPVPEPSTLASGLFGIALAGGAWLRRRLRAA